jgi:ubiquinone/menaquinone biosynthesis C-methylase UbiE
MDPTTRFTSRAEDYAAHRPAYGDDVIEFVLEGLGAKPRVADLGAGTGISSRLLAAHGAQVLAVEPNAAMCERAQPMPGVTFVDGTAESTTLLDASVDAATAFQAFHWFRVPEALAEIRRIVRPGGQAALVLNERDESDAFTAAFGDIVRRYALEDTERRRMESMDAFEQLRGLAERRQFLNGQELDREGLLRRTRSASYLPREGPQAAALEHEVGELFSRYATAGRLRLALVTWVVRVRLKSS